ncbi:hypothetical protein H6G98_10380 [Nostoc sp. FACHB-857]|nr:hypothetical protein [Nostoc sp. FACHB-857]
MWGVWGEREFMLPLLPPTPPTPLLHAPCPMLNAPFVFVVNSPHIGNLVCKIHVFKNT